MWLARPRNGANLPGLIDMETTDPENSGMTGEQLLGRLHWRYATKRFDPQRKIPPADWQTLEQVLVLTPSSFGLQPWKFLVNPWRPSCGDVPGHRRVNGERSHTRG